jgi:hypothetical protein
LAQVSVEQRGARTGRALLSAKSDFERADMAGIHRS